jgi:hypothetical protein
MRRIIFLIASVVVSGFFLWVALRGVDFQQVMKSIQQAEISWILVSDYRRSVATRRQMVRTPRFQATTHQDLPHSESRLFTQFAPPTGGGSSAQYSHHARRCATRYGSNQCGVRAVD